MKSIVILVDQLYQLGGIEKLVSIKANYWTQVFGYKITIISSEQLDRPFAFDIDERVNFIDLKVNYDRKKSYFSLVNLKKLYSNVLSLKRILKITNPDFVLVASHIPITYIVPFISGNAKTIKEFHYTKFYSRESFKESIFSFFENRYDYLAVLSKEEESFYKSNKTVVIPNPLLPNPIIGVRETLKLNKAVFVGRIAPVKNLECMVLVWEKFVQKHTDWVLEIYGELDDEYSKQIIQLVDRKNLNHAILFKGSTNSVLKKIAQAKLMLLTSHQECFPMVILEALSIGVPVFSFDSPTGPRNILTNGHDGRIIKLGDTSSFAEALSTFADDEDLQVTMGVNAINTAKKYNLNKVMETWKSEIFEK